MRLFELRLGWLLAVARSSITVNGSRMFEALRYISMGQLIV